MVTLAAPSHPGRLLKDLYLDPLDMSAAALAARLEVPHMLIARLIAGEAVFIQAYAALPGGSGARILPGVRDAGRIRFRRFSASSQRGSC